MPDINVPPRLPRVLLAVVLVLATVASCASIPDRSSPRVIGDLGGESTAADRAIGPVRDAAPEIIVRDFLKANAHAASDYAASRKFLVPAGTQRWEVPSQAVVVSKIDVIPTERTANVTKMTIRAQSEGRLGSDGTYEPSDGSITQNVQLASVDGQWRIQGLSDVDRSPMLLIDSEEFRSAYRRYLLYYPDPSGRTMVPDARWLASSRQRLPGDLLNLLVRGPRASLQDAVFNPFGRNSSVRGSVTDVAGSPDSAGVGYSGVRVDFDGVPKVEPDVAKLLAGQVVWTLAGADVQGPYVITADGVPLDDKHPSGWNQNDVASVSPTASSDLAMGLHGVLDGRFVKVTSGAATPVAGTLGQLTNIQSVGMSGSGRRVAAVLDTRDRGPDQAASLLVGAYGGVPTQVLTARSMTRPSWMPDDATLWTVLDGNRVVRLRQDQSTGEVTQMDVDSSEVAPAAPGPITALRLSRDGVRVALVVGGKVLVGVVQQKTNGQPMIAHLQQIATDRDMSASSVDWVSGDEFVVGRTTSDSPVLSVRYDSGDVTALPSRNLSPPVSTVAATQNDVYAADSSGVWEIPIGADASSQYWSQVDRLAGARANPVLPG
ncbi:MtrAB system accessory lipoprotein LpqB [Tsukamurella sp. 8F]|uniref:MtrAB system accessory lipoprotein LpqB n=1 Tax=unclassified Tsukamurella TaxID=2633480 RepID=UPI0023B9125F|nr:MULTISPECIES: MtrAB system accessory lipoprotein LpqB [unclassified Tsukamurella]MDF0529045.1 MtrAB system accessory lipoprotein LpqB [Tsukamurella sp. 8J]MDF0587418.1 MtrAB system accessory lipoprotein LpqB [Tsukamurella sp. 8F]